MWANGYNTTMITLGLPPSINAMYRHKGNVVYKTAEAKAWIKESLPKFSRVRKFKPPYEIDLYFYYNRDFDVDNRIKACLDLLQEAEVIDNDKNVLSISAHKYEDKKNPRMEVFIYEV